MPSDPESQDFDYALPPELIAQHPPAERDGGRLLVLERGSGHIQHQQIRDLSRWLAPGDLLVRNVTSVLPARLRGQKETGGAAEALLLGEVPGSQDRYRALLKARGKLRPGLKLCFARGAELRDAEVVAVAPDGVVTLAFATSEDPYAIGETPLPPYIRRDAPEAADASRYQTIFAQQPGSVAAPTAGLHFSERLLEELSAAGVECADVVLHVGPGTFRPPREAELAAGRLHSERFELPQATAERVDRARARGGRVVAVGTTSARVLETCASDAGRVEPRRGETDLFLRPGSAFRAIDALLTNFHLPGSSLLMLVAAFAGRERVLHAYSQAVNAGYRFYSYGDAMLLV